MSRVRWGVSFFPLFRCPFFPPLLLFIVCAFYFLHSFSYLLLFPFFLFSSFPVLLSRGVIFPSIPQLLMSLFFHFLASFPLSHSLFSSSCSSFIFFGGRERGGLRVSSFIFFILSSSFFLLLFTSVLF